MNRPASLLALAFVFAAVLVVIVATALGRAPRADAADGHKIVYLHVTGRGPTARAWYFSAPGSGVLVQDALDKFASEGFHYSAISSSGVANMSAATAATASGDSLTEASYVILLER